MTGTQWALMRVITPHGQITRAMASPSHSQHHINLQSQALLSQLSAAALLSIALIISPGTHALLNRENEWNSFLINIFCSCRVGALFLISGITPPPAPDTLSATSNRSHVSGVPVFEYFEFVNKHLVLQEDLVPHVVGGQYDKWFLVEDIKESDRIANEYVDIIRGPCEEMLSTRHEAAMEGCTKNDPQGAGQAVLDTGGWCLAPGGKGAIEWNGTKFAIPQHHVMASKRIATELLKLIDDEHIKSVNDFGAGVGQYKDVVSSERPDVVWNSYDGAGNVREYTKGFVNYFDLTLPLELPRADWVVSLEVGEHVPSKFEAMLIRNMHHHNCKGIILSWGVIGQGGHSHINLHSNEYVINLFDKLGYREDLELKKRFRNPQDNYGWFTGSTMVFRRSNETIPSVCNV